MGRKATIEILIAEPNPNIPQNQKGVHENLWLKQSSEQYLSIGVYLEGQNLRYYIYQKGDHNPKIYHSLKELKQDLPKDAKNIFDNQPELFMMGHARGGGYGLGNIHGPSEEIIGDTFDDIISDFNAALLPSQRDVIVNIEGCNTDDLVSAKRDGQEKTFLERVSINHPNITFTGTAPWDSNEPQTGYRASGGFPVLNVPVSAVNGDAWKHPNSERVVFYHSDMQVIAKRLPFASIESAKALKVNTVMYAQKLLDSTTLEQDEKSKIINKISLSRDVVVIEDLQKISELPKGMVEDEELDDLLLSQYKIQENEKSNYLARVQQILMREATERDVLTIALGLKNISVFDGHEKLLNDILENKRLMQLVMVSCGKVLIADSTNDGLIDFLIKNKVDINSADANGMTALHHAMQDFFNYRKEPAELIQKLVSSGANPELKDIHSRTPMMVLDERSSDPRVKLRSDAQMLLRQGKKHVSVDSSAAPKFPRYMHHTHASFFRTREQQKSSFPPAPCGLSIKTI